MFCKANMVFRKIEINNVKRVFIIQASLLMEKLAKWKTQITIEEQ